jgi:glycine dehydrogenase subunit 1
VSMIKPHTFMPNSAPEQLSGLLASLKINDISELYSAVPEWHQWDPAEPDVRDRPPKTEREVARRLGDRLRNDSAGRLLCFRGGGCAPHHVPAVCHEIASRREFLTVFAGTAHTNRGVFQAQFEFQSLMAELLDMELVGATCYDWGWAAAKGIRLGLTVTQRPIALVTELVGPHRLEEIKVLCGADRIELLPVDRETGSVRKDVLASRLASGEVGAVYLEMPSYVGTVEASLAEIIEATKDGGAISVLGTDPLALGILESPGVLGADIACGTLHGLGIPMNAGGGEAGFLACRSESRLVQAFPDLLVGAVETDDPGEPAFFWVNFEDTQYGLREEAADFTGTTQAIWSIVAAAYLAMAGRTGIKEVGEAIVARSQYLRRAISKLPGIRLADLAGAPFKEHAVVLPDDLPVAELNRCLRQAGIMGGIDLTSKFSWLGNCMLLCVTEEHSYDDIDALTDAIGEALATRVGEGTAAREGSS